MLTITEALAEIATIDKRLPKKVTDIRAYIGRHEQMRDPLEEKGGSRAYIAEQRQSYGDLLQRKIELRRAIANSNAVTELTIDGTTRTVADWLVWKREVYPAAKALLSDLQTHVRAAMTEARQKNWEVSTPGKPADVVINVDQTALMEEFDALEETFGRLDGLLSLKNATTTI